MSAEKKRYPPHLEDWDERNRIEYDDNRMTWVSPYNQLPAPRQTVLARYHCGIAKNHSNLRVVEAWYVYKYQIKDSDGCAFIGSDYCEETDEWYMPPGWYALVDYAPRGQIYGIDIYKIPGFVKEWTPAIPGFWSVPYPQERNTIKGIDSYYDEIDDHVYQQFLEESRNLWAERQKMIDERVRKNENRGE